jgi:uncharacterized protein YjiS (DUF1127 family)
MTDTILAAARRRATPGTLVRLLGDLHRRYVERRTLSALARLHPHLLRDIGFTDGADAQAVRRMLLKD